MHRPHRISDSDVTELQRVLGGRFTDSKNLLKDLRRDVQTWPDTSQGPSIEAYLINKRYDYRISRPMSVSRPPSGAAAGKILR
jgi:hypothetical protein